MLQCGVVHRHVVVGSRDQSASIGLIAAQELGFFVIERLCNPGLSWPGYSERQHAEIAQSDAGFSFHIRSRTLNPGWVLAPRSFTSSGKRVFLIQ